MAASELRVAPQNRHQNLIMSKSSHDTISSDLVKQLSINVAVLLLLLLLHSVDMKTGGKVKAGDD